MAQRTQLNQILELGVSYRQMNTNIMHDAIIALAQERARARVSASAPAAITDSSGGTANAGNKLVAVVTPTIGLKDGVTEFSPKAGFDTATAAIAAGNKELVAKVNAFLALITGTSGVRMAITTAGTNNGTIEAITAALTAVATNCVNAATGRAEIVKARNMQAAIQSAINYCRVAMGLAPNADGSGGVFERTVSGWDVDAMEVAATSAAITVNGAETLTDTTTDAALAALVKNLSSMAASLNEARGTLAIGPFVVATSNARSRLLVADTTV